MEDSSGGVLPGVTVTVRNSGTGVTRAVVTDAEGRSSHFASRVDQWFDPKAFVLQPAGTVGNTGRGDFTGPDLRTLDVAVSRNVPWGRLGAGGFLQFRVECFNVLNRANFGSPSLSAFAGTRDGETPFATFGRISTTVTSARQIQVGVRAVF